MVKTSIIVSALTGAFARLVFEPDVPFFRAVILVFSGASAAVFTSPMVVHYLSIKEELSHSVTFILGLVSMKIAAILIAILDKLKENPTPIINYVRRIFGADSNK